MSVTIFKNIKQTTGGDDFPIADIMDAIKEGTWQTKVAYYRGLPDETEAQIKERKKAKTTLPYFTGSGTFTKRADAGIKKHNGRLILDIDEVEDVDEVKSLVCADPYTEYCFTSVGGGGVAVVVKIDSARHLESWKALAVYYKKKFGLIVDKSTKDISRARFVSYDPQLWHNERAVTFRLKDYGQLVKDRSKKIIEEAKSGEVHNALIRASRLMGGYIAGNLIDEFEGEEFLVDIMRGKSGVVNIETERKKIQDGINNGKISPINAASIKSENKQTEKEKETWREIYSYIHEINRMGRKYTETDIKHICEQHLISKAKISAAFKKVRDENADEFGIDDKPDIYKVELWLKKTWEFAENEITQVTEYREKKEGSKFELLNIDTIFRKMQHVGFKFPMDKLKSLLKSDFVTKYNPFHDYFNNLDKWDGKTDHIGEFSNFVTTKNQDFYNLQFKKTLVRCISCSLYGKENRIVFVLIGEKQNTGKSTFIRAINPFGTKYYTEAALHNNKDSSFALAENFIYNLEELASLSNIDVNRLKSIISTNSIKERKAYARDVTEQPRRVNFFATSNKTEFLTDSENTRWLIFNVVDINWGYSKIDIRKMWSQAYSLYKDPDFNDQLTQDESNYRDKTNKDYEINDYEKELIKRHFKSCEPNEGTFFSNADILEIIEEEKKKLNSRFIGKNMVQLGFIRAVKKMNGHTVRGYWAIRQIADYTEKSDDFGDKKPF